MLPSILLAAVLASQAALSAEDVPEIVAAVVDWVTTNLEQPLGDRPVFLAAESADAFRAVLPPEATVSLTEQDGFTVRPTAAVTTCSSEEDCAIADDGILVTILAVWTGDEPGNEQLELDPDEYIVTVRLLPPQYPTGQHRGPETHLIMTDSDGGWRVVDGLVLVY